MRLMIIAVLALALASCRRDGNTMFIVFDDVKGLETGADVYYEGTVVGEVLHLELIKGKVLAAIKLQESVRVPINSKFIIKSSLSGSGYLSIQPYKQPTFFDAKGQVQDEIQCSTVISNDTAKSTQ